MSARGVHRVPRNQQQYANSVAVADERDISAPGQVARRDPQPGPGGDLLARHVTQHKGTRLRLGVRGDRPGEEPLRLERGLGPVPVLHQGTR